MKKRVKIVALPKARTGYQVQGSLANDVPAMGGADYDAYIGKPKAKVNSTLNAVPRDEANLEAEHGETAVGNLNGNGIPSQKRIVGKRHYEGGVPLNLPEGTFIYSDTNSMKIKDPALLKMFGKGGSTKPFTPADLAKQYDIDKYTAILKDPDSDVIEKKTAEIMIRNYNMKLGALALAQESKKGFPQGIPGVAAPYVEANNINPDSLLPPDMLGSVAKKEAEAQEADMQKDPRETQQLIGEIQQMMQQRMPIEKIVSDLLEMETSPKDILGAFMELGVPQEKIEPIITNIFAEMQESAKQQSQEQEMPEESQEEPMMRYGGMRDLKAFLYGGQEYLDSEYSDESIPDWMPPAAYIEEAKLIENPNIPEAEYGMAMGANPQNYMGRRKDMIGSRPMFYEVGGYLPKAGDGIEIKRSDLKGKTPEEINNYYQDIWLQHNRGKKASEQKPIYIIEDDGRKTLLKAQRTYTKYSGDVAKDFYNNEKVASYYQTLRDTMSDDDVKKIFVGYVRDALKNKEKYKGGSGYYKTWEELGYGDLSDDDIFNYFDEHQRRNYKLYASGNEASFYGDSDEKLRAWDDTKDRKGNVKEGFWTRIQKIKKPDGTSYTEQEARDLHKKLSNEAPTLTQAYKNIGEKYVADPKSPGYSDTDKKAIYAMQGTFQGYNDLVNDYNSGKFDDKPELKRKMAGLIGQLERGAADEGYGTSGRISPIDGYHTDTTSGQLGAAGILSFTEETNNTCTCEDGTVKEKVDGKCPCEEKQEAKKCKCQKADGTQYELVAPPDYPNTPCPCVGNKQIPIKRSAPWWLQDTIKTTGAFGDLMGIKKHMPWEAPVMLERPKPVFMSPEREMANLNEQTKIATDALSQFAGPQAASARSSSIFGQGATQAANILQRYNNYNVNLANQFELKSTDIANQENMLKQAAATRLYDKNTIANQQYDNAKLAMRNQLRNYYTNAITNRWKTDALNQMYPQYEVDPSVGGRMYYDELAGRTIGAGGAGGSSDAGEQYRQIREYYKDKGLSEADATDAADKEMKHRNLGYGSSGGDDKMGVIKGYYGKTGGTMKKGGYVYGDILYPFVL